MSRFRYHTCFIALFGLAALTACHSPRTRVNERVMDLRHDWQTNVTFQANLPERQLDWPAAVAQLMQHNLKLRQSGVELTNSQEAVRQIFKELIPTLNLRAGVSRDLKSLSATTINDVTFSADSFFNIPGMVSFGARLYTARLYQLRAEAAYQLALREQVIDLYKLFIEAQDTQLQREHVSAQKTTADAISNVEPFTGQIMKTEAEVQEINNARETQTIQQRAGDLLGSLDYRWIFVTNGLPDLHYATDPLPLDDTNRVAQLQIKLVAIELEAARAQRTGIKLRYWPELNIFISGPPIYQRAFGTDQFWNADQLRASADLFWYIDTRGYVSQQLRMAKRQEALQLQRIRQDSLTLIERLLNTRTLLQASLDQAKQVDEQLAVMKAVPPSQNYAALYKYSDDYRVLADQQKRLRREIAELETLFWFVDEDAWRGYEMGSVVADARK